MLYNIRRLAYANLKVHERKGEIMTLKNAESGREYTIKNIITDDDELDAFLFSLGCYSGEKITLVAHRRGGCVVSIKDARYNIDYQLADAISIEE